MKAQPALILAPDQLEDLLAQTAKQAADQAVAALREDLARDPREQLVHDLRAYILDHTTEPNPESRWANGHHIRQIELNGRGRPKSLAWFQKFKQDSGLAKCPHRSSPQHGRLQEWTFRDIALAWHGYYAFR
ncbi:MAG: hypothetical protein JJ908_05860 [Rhizobiales bacterium]|nr:hypothetical protein [Hyphomicrobiales bacterium]MBO6697869.1 hypothetical protein [Hyphomicrobiales bacterium]MBO6735877.1 hypothetical protein [Hyphomicrobiales bacterium]MBO6913888.1 hypothetical protein [Hyphomicrobiales bacterium]MBO6955591.1 hypothetical protein [Hyphomicrobiales bacterium]